ncbi:hypothetical protein LX16_2076 [Stackebrandtia albiflava]|uniref:Activator of Hsp90 ATPase-like protein n=1 Tax=Stackebrandtia albiflava TaxID=406432 RepID=A0A562VEU9_9ACTN|nr:hypothetical protein [Stackebrandtia albiflava]TWJ16347.1 hypothetical protein LX16_2076 [Stackebrandtia albiflava]
MTAPRRRASDEALIENTGGDWRSWFAVLDAWGATTRRHADIAAHLAGEHRVPEWWAQTITVGYEQDRGMRLPGERPDGTFEIGVSVTVGLSSDEVFDWWDSADRRARWLPGDPLSPRTADRPRRLRFDFTPDDTRVAVELVSRGDHRAAVRLRHERLPDPETAATRREFWRDRLAELKTRAEAYRPM